ncbi:MAG: hypothetical protein WBG50_06510 [Desulfomonilaceae bacterium]
MARFYKYTAFLPHNKALLTELAAITDRPAIKVIKGVETDKVENPFVSFHDSFAEYFGNDGKEIIILNWVPPERLMTSFRRILGDVLEAGVCKSLNMWFMTSLNWGIAQRSSQANGREGVLRWSTNM